MPIDESALTLKIGNLKAIHQDTLEKLEKIHHTIQSLESIKQIDGSNPLDTRTDQTMSLGRLNISD